ncbi:ABC-F family ATP-binding cassette domain-containing protein [bacterium]|nr:ABC-F family ATP-binding cassette domain-containing protein [bacterium]
MLKVFEVSKAYSAQTLFDRVSFNINEGEHIGLVGRNGSGKTTLFRLLLGLEETDSGKIGIPKNYSIGYLRQHLHFTKATILEEACQGLPLEQEYDHWRVEKILFGLGFTSKDMQRSPQEFSGGFQIRLNLTKTLVFEPDLLLLDEPTNYLDIVSIRWLEKFLRTWKREFMLITHDRQFMDSVTTHTMAIHRGKVRKIQGNTGKLYQQIWQEEEIQEKTRSHEEKRRKETELFIRRFRAKARLAGMVQSRIKSLEKKQKIEQLEKLEEIEFRFSYAAFPGQQMLQVENLGFHYHPKKPWLIEALNFVLGTKERIAIVGKNGKGKSTLLRVLAEELKPLEGELKKHARLETGYFGQTNILRFNPENTIEDELIMADPRRSRERARTIGGVMLFSGDQALKKIRVLSGGEKSRVLLGKLLLTPSNLLLLDEPTNHLDMESCESLLEALQQYEGSVIFVTHDEIFLHTLAEKLIIFDRDRVLFYHGRYQNFLDDIGWENEEIQKEITIENQTVGAGSPDRNGCRERSRPFPTNGIPFGSKSALPPTKAQRQARAGWTQEKSRVMRPLAVRVHEVEKMIENVEAEISKNNQFLIAASETGDVAAIAELPKKNRQLQSQVDFLYVELEKAHHEHDVKVKYYEEKIKKME